MSEMPGPEHMPMPIVLCRGLCHRFGGREVSYTALHDIDLVLPPGEIVILTGPSGAGKSTLLNLIGGMLAVQNGQLQVLGIEMASLTPRQRLEVRRQIGFVVPELIESLTVAQNVEVGLGHEQLTPQARQQRVSEVLGWLGLDQRGNHLPRHLSGGQGRRVAIARALVHRPRLLLAEEPTASLDSYTSRHFFELLRGRAQREGCTSLIITSDNRFEHAADRIIALCDGHIESNVRVNVAGADTTVGDHSETGR